MSTLRIPVALAASLATFLCAANGVAQETTEDTMAPATSAPATTQPAQTTQEPVQPQRAPSEEPAATTQTTAAPYSGRVDEPVVRTIEHRPNRTLLSTGTGLFILSYGPSVVAATVSDRDEDKRLYIPVVGPWLDLSNRECTRANPCGANEEVAKAMIITSGIVQGASVLMVLGSLMIPESTTITERRRAAAKPAVKVTPVSFGAGAGIGAVGRF